MLAESTSKLRGLPDVALSLRQNPLIHDAKIELGDQERKLGFQ
jgi:hypothetical protein